MIDVFDRYFHLYNDQVSYLFYVMANGQLGHLYYGQSLGTLSEAELAYLADHSNRDAGTTVYDPALADGNFSLADRMQEFPIYGTGDFREGCLTLTQAGSYLYPEFTYVDYQIDQGKKRGALPVAYGDQAEILTVRLEDQERQLGLTLQYTIFPDCGAIVRGAELRNLGNIPLEIRRFQSGCLDLPEADYNFLRLNGAWTKERHLDLQPLAQGVAKAQSLRGASSHQENPFVALVDRQVTNNHGNIFASNLLYSGNFISQVEVDEWGTSRLLTGISPDHFTWGLDAGAGFKAPEAVFFYTDAGYNGLMTQTHAFAKKHVIAPKWRKQERPIVINNWEATYFDFTEEKLLALAKKAQSLGFEAFVLDDGWFEKRNSEKGGLGNWRVDRKKFPKGLAHFSDQVHKMGMQFGLWFEPEMVSDDVELFQKHPDWIVRHPFSRTSLGRNQYVLDFANPAVVNEIFDQMQAVIRSAKVDYVKWDMNRYLTEVYSPYLAKLGRDQGEFFHRYQLGVYALYEKLLAEFPDLLIEGCASGGGRFDLGILYYSPQIWPSDDTDAAERLDILTGTMLAYPLSAFSNHVSAAPNDQIQRLTGLKFRQDVNSFGPLGYELDLGKLSGAEQEKVARHLAWYKQRRELCVDGDFSFLLPVGDQNNTYAYSVRQDDAQLVGFYRKLAKPNETLDHYLRLSSLQPEAWYEVNNRDRLRGNLLHQIGLRLPYQLNGWNSEQAVLKGDFQSYLYEVKKLD